MKWTKLTLTTTNEALEAVSCMLGELGIEGIEIIDNVPISEEDRKRLFIDFLPETDTDDYTAKVNFYLDENIEYKEKIKEIQAELEKLSDFLDVGSKEIEISITQDVDWINNWKEHFKPFRLEDNIIIRPTWEEPEDVHEDDVIIQIDPGTAFGTGSHETTKLCIGAIKKYVNETTTLLDIGCGSGILSIAALKLGAKSAIGVDVDSIAKKVAKENAALNEISKEQFQVYTKNLLDNPKDIDNSYQLSSVESKEDNIDHLLNIQSFDIIVANILADVIIPLSQIVPKHLKKGGIFISSGIINTKKDMVKEAILENGFTILEINEMNDWISIIAEMSDT